MTEREEIKAIKGLENIIEYWTHRPGEVVTAKLAIQALEKQIGKKPILKILKGTSHYMISIYECGECGERADTRWNGCPYCLTKIDWSEEE